MNVFRKGFKKSLAAALVLGGIGITALSHGFVGGVGPGLGRNIRTPLHVNGSVVCIGCSLEEVKRAQPKEHDLYQFSHKNGQLVFKVASVNDGSLSGNRLRTPGVSPGVKAASRRLVELEVRKIC